VAFAKLACNEDIDAQGIGTMLLQDIRQVFIESDADRIFSRVLIENLLSMSDRPWSEARREKPITEPWLARKLRFFGVHSKNLRLESGQAKGYEKADFDDAFSRYLPDLKVLGRPNVPSQQRSDVDEHSDRPAEDSWDGSERPNERAWDGS